MKNQDVASIGMALTFVLLAVNPDSPVLGASFIFTVVLFGFLQFLDRNKIDRANELEAKIRNVQDKIEALMIGRGLGR